MVEFLIDTTRTMTSLVMGGHLERHPDVRPEALESLPIRARLVDITG